MSYNGWSNWATWNMNMWVVNDEDVCDAMVAARPFTPETVGDFLMEYYPDGTPDMDSHHDCFNVNHAELAEAWNEELE